MNCPYCGAEAETSPWSRYVYKCRSEARLRSHICYERELTALRQRLQEAKGLLMQFLHNPHRKSLMGWWNLFNSSLNFPIGGKDFLSPPQPPAQAPEPEYVRVRRDDLVNIKKFVDQIIAAAAESGGTFTGNVWYDNLAAALKEKP